MKPSEHDFWNEQDPGDLDPTSSNQHGSHEVGSKSPGSCSFQKSRSQRFHSVWTPFDIPFLRNTKIGKKKTAIRVGPPVSRLVPKMI